MSDDNVAEATRKAAKEEEERRKRIADKQKLVSFIYHLIFFQFRYWEPCSTLLDIFRWMES